RSGTCQFSIEIGKALGNFGHAEIIPRPEIRTRLGPRSQNRDLGHPVLWLSKRVASGGIIWLLRPHHLRRGRGTGSSRCRAGGCSTAKPRSQNRDLGHPVLWLSKRVASGIIWLLR